MKVSRLEIVFTEELFDQYTYTPFNKPLRLVNSTNTSPLTASKVLLLMFSFLGGFFLLLFYYFFHIFHIISSVV